MSGYDHLKTHSYQPGEKCWLLVDKVNRPTGRWQGEIISASNNLIKAKITDQNILNTKLNHFFDKEPHQNYKVIPSNPYTDYLLDVIESLKITNEDAKITWEIREKALMDAFAAIGRNK